MCFWHYFRLSQYFSKQNIYFLYFLNHQTIDKIFHVNFVFLKYGWILKQLKIIFGAILCFKLHYANHCILNNDTCRFYETVYICTVNISKRLLSLVLFFFLAHLNQSFKWAFLINYRPLSVFLSVHPSVCKLLTLLTSFIQPLC